jgi:hypothetical protein
MELGIDHANWAEEKATLGQFMGPSSITHYSTNKALEARYMQRQMLAGAAASSKFQMWGAPPWSRVNASLGLHLHLQMVRMAHIELETTATAIQPHLSPHN